MHNLGGIRGIVQVAGSLTPHGRYGKSALLGPAVVGISGVKQWMAGVGDRIVCVSISAFQINTLRVKLSLIEWHLVYLRKYVSTII